MSADEQTAREVGRLQALAMQVRSCLALADAALLAASKAKDPGAVYSYLRGSAHTFTEAALRLLLLV